jgi:hypothetical protein
LLIKVTDIDRAGMIRGFEIEPDFCLGLELEEVKKKSKKLKRKPKRPDSVSSVNSQTY